MFNIFSATSASSTLSTAYCTTGSFLNEDEQAILLATYGIATTSISLNHFNSANVATNYALEYVDSLSNEELAKLIELADNKVVELSNDNSAVKVKTLK